jgi:hypothetical protein
MEIVDVDGDGEISFEEFKNMMLSWRGNWDEGAEDVVIIVNNSLHQRTQRIRRGNCPTSYVYDLCFVWSPLLELTDLLGKNILWVLSTAKMLSQTSN